ncbi:MULTISPECIES: ABC transporter substrate-binding protein [unclassified Streptomyces]|uniref:ABC transporter substrate-binding protein n=1 Tax=unclassified Streptomyces TaxID=2593676 RepID=UPI003444161C
MRPRYPALSGTALALALAAVGCSVSADTFPPAGGATARAATVTSCGKKLTFGEAPSKAVSLDQSSTESLLELGVEARMAGTSNLKTEVGRDHADAYGAVPVLSPGILSGEQLRAATPDLVVSSFTDLYSKDRVGTREELGRLGVPTYVSAVDCPQRNDPGKTPFDLLFDDFRNLGEIFGVEERAEELVREQRAAVGKAARTGRAVTGAPTVVWLYSVYNAMPYVAGRGGMPSEMSRLLGARNVFDDVNADWPEVSWEEIADRDPDIIVIGDLSERGAPGDSAEDKRATMRGEPAVSALTALRENRVIEVPGIEMDPSVRTVNTLRLLAEGMKDLGHVR